MTFATLQFARDARDVSLTPDTVVGIGLVEQLVEIAHSDALPSRWVQLARKIGGDAEQR